VSLSLVAWICRDLVNRRDEKFPRDVFPVSAVLVKFHARAGVTRYTGDPEKGKSRN